MSWTDYNQYQINQINTGTTTPLSSISSGANNNKNYLVQELNSKLISSAFNSTAPGAVNSLTQNNSVNYTAPSSTVSSVSSDSIEQQQQNNNHKMGTQIDHYFANEDSAHVSSNFWNIHPGSTQHNHSEAVTSHIDQQYNPQQTLSKEDQFRNTIEEENFLQNQVNQSLNNELWTNTNYQANNNILNNSSLNHSNSDQSLFDLMKYGYTGSGNQMMIPNNLNNNNTQFNTNNTNTTTNGQSNGNGGLSYTASTTPLPSTPLTNTSPEQMVFQTAQYQQQQQPQQSQPPQPLQQQEQLLNNSTNTQNVFQNYQQQQLYLEQLQQQHQQLLQNPLFIQQQAQLVSQQLQQLQLQLQLQKQQLESNNYQLLNLQNGAQGGNTPGSTPDLKLPLTEENLIKLQQSPKDPSSLHQAPPGSTSAQQQTAPSTTTSSGNGDNKSSVNTELYKTELCSTFNKTGSCPYGNKCQFAHGGNELKVVNRGSKYRSKPCANWTKTGTCRYGNRCCFKHGN